MAREYDLQGLDNNTRRKNANRPFEDVKGIKIAVPGSHRTEVLQKTVEDSASERAAKKVRLYEEPPLKARLTVRERKRRYSKTGVSLAASSTAVGGMTLVSSLRRVKAPRRKNPEPGKDGGTRKLSSSCD